MNKCANRVNTKATHRTSFLTHNLHTVPLARTFPSLPSVEVESSRRALRAQRTNWNPCSQRGHTGQIWYKTLRHFLLFALSCPFVRDVRRGRDGIHCPWCNVCPDRSSVSFSVSKYGDFMQKGTGGLREYAYNSFQLQNWGWLEVYQAGRSLMAELSIFR